MRGGGGLEAEGSLVVVTCSLTSGGVEGVLFGVDGVGDRAVRDGFGSSFVARVAPSFAGAGDVDGAKGSMEIIL